MVTTIMPSFMDSIGQMRPESAIIGRLLAGYGELEVSMMFCVAILPGNDLDTATKSTFSVRGEKDRIDRAAALLKPDYSAAGFGAELTDTISDMHWCREIRNQFSHCQWISWHRHLGLKFVNLEDVAAMSGTIRKLATASHDVSLSILQDQEAYFNYVMACFSALAQAFKCKVAAKPNRGLPRPAKMARPQKHS